jgi:hypothetical protein
VQKNRKGKNHPESVSNEWVICMKIVYTQCETSTEHFHKSQNPFHY